MRVAGVRFEDRNEATHRNRDRRRGTHVERVVAPGLVNDANQGRDLVIHPITLGDAFVVAPLLKPQLGSTAMSQHVLAYVHGPARSRHWKIWVALEGGFRADFAPLFEPLSLFVVLDSQGARLLVLIVAVICGLLLRWKPWPIR